MIALRISSRLRIQNQSTKLFSQTLKQTSRPTNVVFCKYLSHKCDTNAPVQQKHRSLLSGQSIHSLRWLSVQSRLYSVNAQSLKESDNYRSDHNITVVGDDVPDPIQTISEDTFPDYIMKYLQREGIEKPTIIQAQGWPIAMAGKNLVGIAQTGTGKTLAYLIPAVLNLKEKEVRKGSSPVVLILAPTRELARQIQQVAYNLTRQLGIRTACVYGGASRSDQIRELERGVDILIATPGRLIDFLNSKTTNLDRCTYLVMDEADRMLDMGFEPQIREIADQISLERQILMWSATWPKEVQALAQDYLGEFIQVNVGSTDLSANHNIKQVVHVCEENEKSQKLNEILQEIVEANSGKVLIFTNMKRTVEDVTHRLRLNGWPAVGIHGNKTQKQRDSIIYQFKHGRAKILVASDVAARGLDVDNVTHVINYDYPMNSEDYIHRIGRTGRSDATGTSHSLLTLENARQARDLMAIMQEANQEIPQELIELSKQHFSVKEKSKQKYRSGFNSYSNNWSRDRFGSSQYGGYNNRFRSRSNSNYRPRREDRYDSSDF